jgi:hypothetical protein
VPKPLDDIVADRLILNYGVGHPPTERWIQLWPDGGEERGITNEWPLRWRLARRVGCRTREDGDRGDFRSMYLRQRYAAEGEPQDIIK